MTRIDYCMRLVWTSPVNRVHWVDKLHVVVGCTPNQGPNVIGDRTICIDEISEILSQHDSYGKTVRMLNTADGCWTSKGFVSIKCVHTHSYMRGIR